MNPGKQEVSRDSLESPLEGKRAPSQRLFSKTKK